MHKKLPGATQAVGLAELYAAHRLALVRLAVLLVDDQASAEDVVQDAFAALARRSNGLRDPSAAVGYLRISVVNGSRSMLRRRRTVRGYEPPRTIESAGPEDRAVVAEVITLPKATRCTPGAGSQSRSGRRV